MGSINGEQPILAVCHMTTWRALQAGSEKHQWQCAAQFREQQPHCNDLGPAFPTIGRSLAARLPAELCSVRHLNTTHPP